MSIPNLKEIPFFSGDMLNIPLIKSEDKVILSGLFESNIHKERSRRKPEYPLWNKSYLTIEEAAVYSGIGRDKLRKLSDDENCPFVLWNGTKRLIKRRKLDEYMDRMYSI